MSLAHQMHRHERTEEHDEDHYGVADVAAVEGVAAGSVTSFVRKLFQMVQEECDSVVGFVADGTAFEVKDPRRLEQDILPKYFRHSRFQSLVRQLNFYSFKKISKERSVWIYKHTFFRRDEPELLHALKRKTNQHGAPGRMGNGMLGADGDESSVEMERSKIGSLSREVHDVSRHRPRAPINAPRHLNGSPFPVHHTGASSFDETHNSTHDSARQQMSRPPLDMAVSTKPGNHASRNNRSSSSSCSSRSAGGGPSTGGVGGAAAPCYSDRGTSSSRLPGPAWGGAGGRPVSDNSEYSDRGSVHARARGSPPAYNPEHQQRSGGSPPPSQRSMSSHAYRQGPAMGDIGGNDERSYGRHGWKRTAPTSSSGAASPGGEMGSTAADREHALAIWGLSALCQVASASEAQGGEAGVRGARFSGGSRGDSFARSPRLHEEGGREQKRLCRTGLAAKSTHSRPDWNSFAEGAEDGDREDFSEDDDGEAIEDGITSAERDDTSASYHSRSPSESSCTSSRRSSAVRSANGESPPQSPARRERDSHSHSHSHSHSIVVPSLADAQHDRRDDRRQSLPHGRTTDGRKSGSGGVFCPTWAWGRATCEPTMRLLGSVGERRSEYGEEGSVRADANDADDDEADRGMMEEDEESSKTEGEDMDDDELEGYNSKGLPQVKTAKSSATATVTATATEASLALTKARDTLRSTSVTQPRDLEADVLAESAVGLDGIGALFDQFSTSDGGNNAAASAAESVFLATVTNSGDGGLREMAVFCAGPAGRAPDISSPASLARQVSAFLQAEKAVAKDLRIYAEALDPAAVDVVVERGDQQQQERNAIDGAKLLRVFCRYAACRLGRALEVASATAVDDASGRDKAGEAKNEEARFRPEDGQRQRQRMVAQRVTPRLYQCRWKWWRAAVRFS